MIKDKIIYSDNGTLQDVSFKLSKYRGQNFDMSYVSGEDYIYIGSNAPFNSLFFSLATPNATAANMTVEYWTDNWTEVVELEDLTNGFSQNGSVTFVPDRLEQWKRDHTNYSNATITGLEAVTIYSRFWVRIKFDVDLDANTLIKFVGQKFCSTDDISAEYPDITRLAVIEAFETGKQDWEEQIILASELVVQHLIKNQVIYSKSEILDAETFKLATISKTAELIFKSFGDDYINHRELAKKEFKARMDLSVFNVDEDADGELEPSEQRSRQGFMSR